ncbi:SUF system NifU family Fe-S cluster assembly protein [Candidatus Peregrinibacteria bacterium]|nr:SUF system NifU family Fe-S cluster assembly protein [Candidatus Peregrinibacteria bacterium]
MQIIMDLYPEIILDHFKNPRNKGIIKNPTKTAEKENTLCGDKIRIDLLLDKNKKVRKIRFSGEGCAISQASASMLTEKLHGKPLSQIKKIPPKEIYKMLGIEISPARSKCALLSLETVKKAVNGRRHNQ